MVGKVIKSKWEMHQCHFNDKKYMVLAELLNSLDESEICLIVTFL